MPADHFQISDPETGDCVLVFHDFLTDRMECIINGAPAVPVPQGARGKTIAATAFNVLRDHQAQCAASDAEELTLP